MRQATNRVADEDEEIATAQFISTVLPQLEPRQRYLTDLLTSEFLDLEPDFLMRISEECFAGLTLIWAGLPPAQQERMVNRLAPLWARYRALQQSNQQRAKALLAKRRAKAGLNGQSS
jgi:hypothetical protein